MTKNQTIHTGNRCAENSPISINEGVLCRRCLMRSFSFHLFINKNFMQHFSLPHTAYIIPFFLTFVNTKYLLCALCRKDKPAHRNAYKNADNIRNKRTFDAVAHIRNFYGAKINAQRIKRCFGRAHKR